MAIPATKQEHVSPRDIEHKIRELRGEVDSAADSAKSMAIAVGTVIAVVVVGVAFLLGKRRGKRTSTVVEITRV
jgi:hypothetical protein